VGVDLRRAEFAVPKEFFHVNGGNAGADEMRGVGVAKGVRGGPYVKSRAAPVVGVNSTAVYAAVKVEDLRDVLKGHPRVTESAASRVTDVTAEESENGLG